MPGELVSFWSRCDFAEPPFAHPDDWPVLSRGSGKYIDTEPRTFEEFVGSTRFGDFADHRLHLSLLPIPYGGNLADADILILLLNPGFSYTDYYAETRMPAFRERLKANLEQSFADIEYPFLWLDPEFCWHSGFNWWEKKLRDVTTVIAAEKFNGRYLDALRDLSTRLAHIELVPYHSSSFRGHTLIDDLPSARAAKRFVHDTLIPAAKTGAKTIVVTRQGAAWGLSRQCKHLVIYQGGQTRGASLGRDTPGGRAILNRYQIECNWGQSKNRD